MPARRRAIPKDDADAAAVHRRLAARRARLRDRAARGARIPATGTDIFPTPNLTLDFKRIAGFAPSRFVRAIAPGHASLRDLLGQRIRRRAWWRQRDSFDVLGVWAVGTPPTVYPEGDGTLGSQGLSCCAPTCTITRTATPQTDRTRVGLYFGKGELKKEVASALAGNVTFSIPPNAPNFEMRSRLRGRPGHQHRVVLSRTCTCAART